MEVGTTQTGTTHYVRTDVNFELTDFGFSSQNSNCAAHSTVVHNGRKFQISSKNYDALFASKVVKDQIQMSTFSQILKAAHFIMDPFFFLSTKVQAYKKIIFLCVSL